MNTDADFYAAFAGRVRQQLATTRSTAPEGDTMRDTRTQTGQQLAATFRAAPDAQCETYPWCTEKGLHVEHVGRLVELSSVGAQVWQDGDDSQPYVLYGSAESDWDKLTSGDQVRAKTAGKRTNLARLDALADEFDAIREAATGSASADPAPAPRTWSFIDRDSGKPVTMTCMVGCTTDHSSDEGREIFPQDAYCRTYRNGVDLPVTNGANAPESYNLLAFDINVSPFSDNLARRLPHSSVQLVDDDFWIEDMGPDELATVIDALQARVDALREGHARLVEVRAEYMRRAR